jgi:hypothetical protein
VGERKGAREEGGERYKVYWPFYGQLRIFKYPSDHKNEVGGDRQTDRHTHLFMYIQISRHNKTENK